MLETRTGRSATARALLLILVAALHGCGGDSPIDPGSWPAEIRITPAEARLVSLGELLEFTALVRDRTGRELLDLPLEWSVEDEAILSFEGAGRFRALRNGETTVLASVAPEASRAGAPPSARATVRIEQQIDRLELTGSRRILRALGQAAHFMATAVDALGSVVESAGPVSWHSSDPEVVRIDPAGIAIALAGGEVEIEAHAGAHSARTSLRVSPEATITLCIRSTSPLPGTPPPCTSATIVIHMPPGAGSTPPDDPHPRRTN